MKILVLGSSGMAGHVVSMYLASRGHKVSGLSRSKSEAGVTNIIGDVGNENFLDSVLQRDNYDVVVNCAGVLNSDCDKDVEEALRVNSILPHYLQRMSMARRFHLIHISTDCVFSGEGTGPYSESSIKDGTSVYAKTKSLGEVSGPRTAVIRTSIVGPDTRKKGIGLLNWFMSTSGEIRGYTNAVWSGVTTVVLARAVESVMDNMFNGLRHLTNGEGISKKDLLSLFNEELRGGEVKIKDYPDFKNDKTLITNFSDLKVSVPSYREMVAEMAGWIRDNSKIYPHYNIK